MAHNRRLVLGAAACAFSLSVPGWGFGTAQAGMPSTSGKGAASPRTALSGSYGRAGAPRQVTLRSLPHAATTRHTGPATSDPRAEPKGDQSSPPRQTGVRTIREATQAPDPSVHPAVQGADPAPPGIRDSPQALTAYTKQNSQKKPSPTQPSTASPKSKSRRPDGASPCTSTAQKPSSSGATCKTRTDHPAPPSRQHSSGGNSTLPPKKQVSASAVHPTSGASTAMKTSQLSAASYSSNGYSVSITVSPNALSPGGTSTVTATSNVDVGTTAYYIQIYNDGTGNRVSFCGSGTTCSGTVSEASATTDYFTAYVASYSYTEPPPNIQASSDQVSVTWLSVPLSADPTLVGLGGSSTLTAYANADVGPTPYFIEIYDQTSGAFLAECGSGDTCSTSVRQQVRVVKRYVAYVSSYSTSNNPPPNIQVTSAASEVQWKDNPPQAIELTQFAGSDQAHTIHAVYSVVVGVTEFAGTIPDSVPSLTQ